MGDLLRASYEWRPKRIRGKKNKMESSWWLFQTKVNNNHIVIKNNKIYNNNISNEKTKNNTFKLFHR